jgi:hypothetical protein
MESNIPNSALLQACRELVTSRIQATVARVVDDAAVALERQTLGGSVSAPGSESFDTVRELRQRRREFAVCFEHRFRELFDRRLRASETTTDDVTPMVPPGCRAVLLEIDRRLETLLKRPQLPMPPNPMEPEILIAAFNAACADVTAAEPVRRALMELFHRHVNLELPRIYGEVNALLARQGISAARPARGGRADSAEPFSTFPGRSPKLRTEERSARQLEAGDPSIRSKVERLLKPRTLPHFVRTFALETWSAVLALIKTNKGARSLEWELAMKTLEDLIAGVESFDDPVQRRVAIWKLPGLVRRLKSGMGSICVPQQDQALFLKTLRAYHLRVLGQRAVVQSEFPLPESYDA